MAETATPPRKRTPTRKQRNIVKPEQILALGNDVAQNELVERAPEVRALTLGMLAGVNVHQLGPPGAAKSLGLRAFAKRVTGARYFEKSVNPQTPADAIVGGYDMETFAKTGTFQRKVEGYAPTAHIVNIDEITRANGPTQDALLPLFNTEERLYEANGGMKVADVKLLVSSSNFMPDPDDPRAGAFVDRFTLMQYVDYVKADESFMEMLERHHTRRLRERGQADDGYKPVTITLEQLEAAQAEVNAVTLAPEFKEKYAELRRNAKNEKLPVSDRRWMELSRVARASAWLAGRDFLISEDLAAIEHGLWRDRDQIPLAHQLVLPFHGRFEREARKKRQEAEAPLAEWEAIRPLVEGTPPDQDIDPEVLKRAIQCSRKLRSVRERADALLKEAKKEQRDAGGLRDVANDLATALKWFEDNGLPH